MELDFQRTLHKLAQYSRKHSAIAAAYPTVAQSGDPLTQKRLKQEELEERVARYTAWLSVDAEYNAALRESDQRQLYNEAAEQTVSLGPKTIRAFAPFRYGRSAVRTFTTAQRVVLSILVIAILASSLLWGWNMIGLLLAVVTLYYFGNLILTFVLSVRTLDHLLEIDIEDEVIGALANVEWPLYTILCPLYHEAAVVPQFAEAMSRLDYPVDRLQILFLTEENDSETRDAILAQQLPPHFEVITVPNGEPRTKPRACNYGLIQATGDYLVIFDAEDKPDPLQLKKAVLAFANFGQEIGCVQAKLNFYNPNQNLLTRWFTAEYSAWFDATLPGLQWANLALPLGGTSNHFRVSVLRDLGAWDPFNVTEDCDLGLRLARYGMKTVILNSTTFEEANPAPRNWIRQRSRWIKGYMQTYLVYMRQPHRYLRPSRWREFFSLQLIVGARTLILLVNPIMWLLLLIYVLFRWQVEDVYHVLFPGVILYMAVFCLVFGNILYIYVHIIGCLKRGQYHLVKWALLMPLYWALGSLAAYKALYQLITRPHYWEKTSHGLHLPNKASEAKPAQNMPDGGSFVVQSGLQVSFAAEAALSASPGPALGLAMSPVQPEYAVPAVTGFPADSAAGSAQPVSATAPLPVLVGRSVRPLITRLRADRWLMLVFLCSTVASVLSLLYYYQTHQLLLYGDANAHLSIARRVLDNLTPGFAQLGGIWLPLPHLAMVPFVWIDGLWQSGLAGSFVAMPSFIIASVYLFLLARRITRSNSASFIGTLVFILNPNILYMQTTAMTEPILIVTMCAACYYFLIWMQEQRSVQLIMAALMTFLASLARYEGWALFATLFACILIVGVLRRFRWPAIEGKLIAYTVLGVLGIVLWFGWCALIFGDILYFQRSEFSSQAMQLQIISQSQVESYHNVYQSFRYFFVTAIATFGGSIFVLGGIEVVAFLIRRRYLPDILISLALLAPAAFDIFSLYTGQAVIMPPGLFPRVYNVRYGVMTLMPAAVFMAMLASFFPPLTYWIKAIQNLLRGKDWNPRHLQLGRFLCIALIGLQALTTAKEGIVSLQSGQFGVDCTPTHEITLFMALHYNGGQILNSVGASKIDNLGPAAGIDFKNFVYEGSGPYWKLALGNPAAYVEWIIMNSRASDDLVARQINAADPVFLSQFQLLVQEQDGLSLYRRTGLPPLPDRVIPDYLYTEHARCQKN